MDMQYDTKTLLNQFFKSPGSHKGVERQYKEGLFEGPLLNNVEWLKGCVFVCVLY